MLEDIAVEEENLVTDQASDQAILKFCETSKTISEIMEFAGMKHRTYFRNNILNPLLQNNLLALTIPDKPSSPKQRYISKTIQKEK